MTINDGVTSRSITDTRSESMDQLQIDDMTREVRKIFGKWVSITQSGDTVTIVLKRRSPMVDKYLILRNTYFKDDDVCIHIETYNQDRRTRSKKDIVLMNYLAEREKK